MGTQLVCTIFIPTKSIYRLPLVRHSGSSLRRHRRCVHQIRHPVWSVKYQGNVWILQIGEAAQCCGMFFKTCGRCLLSRSSTPSFKSSCRSRRRRSGQLQVWSAWSICTFSRFYFLAFTCLFNCQASPWQIYQSIVGFGSPRQQGIFPVVFGIFKYMQTNCTCFVCTVISSLCRIAACCEKFGQESGAYAHDFDQANAGGKHLECVLEA